MTDYELGYTPNNLKTIRKKYGLSIGDVATITGTRGKRSVQRWEADLSVLTHADMPHDKWVELIKFCDISHKNK